MVLSWFTVRSCCRLKIQSRSLRRARTNALPFSAARTVKRRLNSATYSVPMNSLARARSEIPRTLSSCGRRPCQVPKLRSDRPPACGEYAAIIFTPSSPKARPTSCGTAHLHARPMLRHNQEVAGTIAVQRTEQPSCHHHLAQSNHHRARRFCLDQLCVVDLARGIVQYHDQFVITLIPKPAMLAAINVQHHPRQCPPRPTLAVRSRLLTPLDQSCCLQRCLYPAVTQPDTVQLAQFLVKVLYVEVEVLLPVELQHLLHRLH